MELGLEKLGLGLDPFANFKKWMSEAEAAAVPEPTAMTLATCTHDGRPSARIVLYKGLRESGDERGEETGFRLFTNYESRKSGDLQDNPFAALVFFWPTLQRQIRVEGRVVRLDDASSDEYFMSRARGSRVGAWASPQSTKIQSREELLSRVEAVEERFDGKEVTRPPNWGGWVLIPSRIEFWKAGEFRLHDRFVYERSGAEWSVSRLAP